MPPTPFSQLVNPRFPAFAAGIERGYAAVVQLERKGRGTFGLRRAATVRLPEGLVTPNFDEQNVIDAGELAQALSEVAQGAGLGKQRKWSVALPEAATRTLILTLESAPASRAELEEVLRWKIERGFGGPASPEEMRVARHKLSPDAAGRQRYMVTGVRVSVLEEYEEAFAALGWRAGLIVPRHAGEERWLARGGGYADALLISGHDEGFTAIVLRNRQPLLVRSVACEAEDCDDELYRLLLFYRDRLAPPAIEDAPQSPPVEQLLVTGERFDKQHVAEIVAETLGGPARSLGPAELGLALPSQELSFDHLAAPAGLATLAWA